ncbi:hypothetical protein FB192DRAFT_1275489 [Mucor lusitanicus]|uniref:Swiss Army Knife 2H phosphoesterase domain-containing protein n=1 Tax=Mucor circinelloides f. lusitanicus TaxID=29924 RepID=A0A8H4BLN7_MUCCL|nr:hypothetical protein FB192DRAFT_1275489 [Mucor lusitanicus]
MNFDFQYVKPVFDILNSTQVPLLNRGESHITVISPPEFGVLATAGITIDQVNQIALKEKIQSSKVKIVCLGKEDVNGKIVYQLIVSAPNLVTIREKVFQLFAKQGILATYHCWLYFWRLVHPRRRLQGRKCML